MAKPTSPCADRARDSTGCSWVAAAPPTTASRSTVTQRSLPASRSGFPAPRAAETFHFHQTEQEGRQIGGPPLATTSLHPPLRGAGIGREHLTEVVVTLDRGSVATEREVGRL